MLLGGGDFRAGQTLNKRVPQGGRMMRRISGFDPSRGPLIPEGKPERTSSAALTGSMLEQVILPFRDADGLSFIVRDADEKVRVLDPDGDWSSATGAPTFSIIKDAQPFRLGPLGVFPTEEGLMVYEKDSATTKSRPLGLRSPEDYTEGAKLDVTPSASQIVQAFDLGASSPTFTRNTTGTNQYGNTFGDSLEVTASANGVALKAQWGGAEEDVGIGKYLFRYAVPADCIKTVASAPTAGGTGYVVGDILVLDEGDDGRVTVNAVTAGVVTAVLLASGGSGYSTGAGKATTAATGAGSGCTVNISAIGAVDFSGKDFIFLDMSLTYDAMDPVKAIDKSGAFINAGIKASGYEIAFGVETDGTDEIARHAIPQIPSDGKVYRLAIHLGTMDSTDVKCIEIWSADYFVAPVEGSSWTLRLYSEAYADDWEFKGNGIAPPIKFDHSPWADRLPTDPGTKTTDGVAYPSSATILEEFPENLSNFTPDHPKVKYQYDYRGRSALSIDDYEVIVSDPSAESHTYFADPWRVYKLTETLEQNASSEDVTDEYGDYVTHALLYRKIYTGLGQDQIVEDLGIWSLGTFCGKPRIADEVACTLGVSTNRITTTAAHDLYINAIVKFGTTVGGITAGTSYYVTDIPSTTTFQISTTEGGSALDITGTEGAANTWSAKDLYYYDIGRVAYACTLTDTGDKIACTGHKVYIGDIVTFDTTGSGITKDRPYYVITTADEDYFQVSETVDGDAVTITADLSNTVNSAGKDLTIDEKDIPQYIPLNRAIPDEARYAVPAHNRVYTAHRGYDSDESEWTLQTMMQASNLGDHDGFPVEAVDLAVDGQDLGKFSPESYTIRGLLANDNSVYVGTERGCWELVGTDADSPWQFLRRTSKGWVSGKSAAGDGSQFIVHGPDDDSFYHYVGGQITDISNGIIDSSLIDWTLAHQGVFSKERYVFFCRYDDTDEDDAWALWIYDLVGRGWHSAHDECYEYAGMCVDDETGDVYALTHDGDIVEVFGGTTSYGSDEAVYIAEYQHIVMAPPTETRTTALIAANIITSETSIDMELTISVQGLGDAVPISARTVTITSDQTQYRWPVGVTGDAVSAELVYRGETPPDEISYFAIQANDPVKA